MWDGKCAPKYYHVEFDPLSKDISCSCLLFEFRGIICRHSLLVLGQEDVHNVPYKYVLRRWSKSIRKKHTLIRAAYSSLQQDPKMQRYQSLCQQFYNLAEAACEFECASTQLEKDLKCLAKKFGLSSSLKNNIVSEGGQLRYENPVTETQSYNTCGSSDVLVRSPIAETATSNVTQAQQGMEYASQSLQLSQLSEVAPIGLMSLLSAVHNTFENI
ncbi:protein FAR1-RELATED SEQUENCE 4-like [Vigna radiata var. radiata]|uniref:Protein FAR1-RELATED SEQUENCE n=1 Tax=Vigna radiata var. radiata TaxID=3916 RepID=A0A1S3V0H8_VIGRR|nr:protein FAR1-RELATED SEQUENCE 4-like [Vigna radiata var. radiata]